MSDEAPTFELVHMGGSDFELVKPPHSIRLNGAEVVALARQAPKFPRFVVASQQPSLADTPGTVVLAPATIIAAGVGPDLLANQVVLRFEDEFQQPWDFLVHPDAGREIGEKLIEAAKQIANSKPATSQ
jgi:hypothetical protein